MIRKYLSEGVRAGFTASAIALAVSAQAFAGTVTTDGADLVIKTKSGLEVSTVDKEYSFKLGGRIQADYDRFDGFYTKNNNTADASYFRRAILELSGNYKDWAYVFNYDFGNGGSTNWDQATIAYTGFAPVNIMVGRFDPDFGLQHATSSKWVTANERSAIYDMASWVNDKEDDMGVQVNGTYAGMFYGSTSIVQQKPSSTASGQTTYQDDDGKNVNTFNLRGVVAPIVSESEALHLGLDYAQRSYSDDHYAGKIDSRLQVRGVTEENGNNSNSGKILFAKDVAGRYYTDDQVFGAEFAYMNGPYSIESEYLKRTLSGQDANGDRTATGYNAQIAWTITGESRTYKLDGAKFDKIKPSGKNGAWEVFYRYDNVKVEDDDGLTGAIGASPLQTAKANINTIGVNWYANEAVKVSLDYLMTDTDQDTVDLQGRAVDADDDSGDAVTARLQYVF